MLTVTLVPERITYYFDNFGKVEEHSSTKNNIPNSAPVACPHPFDPPLNSTIIHSGCLDFHKTNSNSPFHRLLITTFFLHPQNLNSQQPKVLFFRTSPSADAAQSKVHSVILMKTMSGEKIYLCVLVYFSTYCKPLFYDQLSHLYHLCSILVIFWNIIKYSQKSTLDSMYSKQDNYFLKSFLRLVIISSIKFLFLNIVFQYQIQCSKYLCFIHHTCNISFV